MDPLYVQNLRYKLQKRVSRLNSVETHDSFMFTLSQFWRFFDQQPTYVGIMELLLPQFPNIDEDVNKIFNQQGVYGESEEAAAALGYQVLRRIGDERQKFNTIGFAYGRISKHSNDSLEAVREVFLMPFYEYVDEQLDDQRAMLALLMRYKHRSEWFYRQKLWDLAHLERVAEKSLALDLYAYLYDQGIDFNMEAESIKGKIDLIAAQNTPDPLLLDAKIFDRSSRGKHYIRKAFRQIYTYTQHFNEPFGFLVIYKTTEYDLRLSLRIPQNIPVVVHNHKTIFLITVDLFPYEQPVSQRSPLQAIEITEEEFIEILEEVDEEE